MTNDYILEIKKQHKYDSLSFGKIDKYEYLPFYQKKLKKNRKAFEKQTEKQKNRLVL